MYSFEEIERRALIIDEPNEIYYATSAFVYSDPATGIPALVQVNENNLLDISTSANDILAAGQYDEARFEAGASIRIDEEDDIRISMDDYREDATGDIVECCICDYFPPEEMTHYPQSRLICRSEVFIPYDEHDFTHGGTSEFSSEEIRRVTYDAMMEGVRMYGTLI